MKMKRRTKDALAFGLLLLVFLLLLGLEWKKDLLTAYEPYGQMQYETVSRLLACVACVVLLCRFSLSHVFALHAPVVRSFLVVLPCFAIAVNNFPFLSVWMGDAIMGSNGMEYFLYALLCLSVGLFEELAFRGCVFTVALERTTRFSSPPVCVLVACVFSSALFGLVHIANLFAGASIPYVLLQVGYSFLIGGMCAIMTVKTGTLWYGVVLHTVYNFLGGIVPEFGGGRIWTWPTIVLTTVVAIPVAVYVFYLLFRVRKEEIDRLLHGEAKSE